MKKYILFTGFLLSLFTTKMSAQITLEQQVDSFSIGYYFKAVHISDAETKWFIADASGSFFNLYNLDWTPFLTNVALPEPMGFEFQVLYITRSLFDCDTSNIEFMYEDPLSVSHSLRIMRTDGTVLLQVDSANAPYCFGSCGGGGEVTVPVINTEENAKMFVQKYVNGTPTILIYGLCGKLPTGYINFTTDEQPLVKLFPNPASETLTFEVTLPDNQNEYELIIQNALSQEVKRIKPGLSAGRTELNTRDFPSGNYSYLLVTPNKTPRSGKFVIAR